MSGLSIGARLMLAFVVTTVVPLTGLAGLYLASFERALTETVLLHVSSIADKKAGQIDTFINERLADARTYAQRQSVRDALIASSLAFRRGGVEAATEAADLLQPEMVTLLESAHYYDLLLIDADGDVVYSVLREPDFCTNLLTGPSRDTSLARGFRQATETLSTNLTPFGPYEPSAGAAAGFAVAPVMDDAGRLLGALALQVNLATLTDVVTDRTGLGRSGEASVAQLSGDTCLFTVPLRHVPDAAFRYRVPLGDPPLPVQRALRGERGRAITPDYAGVEVAGAWAYLPALDWGILVKIDAAEAFAPAREARRSTAMALAGFLLLSGVAAFFVGRSLSSPIRALTGAATRIAEGDLDQRVPVVGGAELETLARAFNRMADRLATARSAVQDRVAELEAFSYTVSHDLRAPLRAIQGYAAVVESELGASADPTVRRLLGRMRDAALRMDHLIRDVLGFSQISRRELTLAPVDLDAVLAQVLANYPDAMAAGVTVRPPLGRVTGQESLLVQILSNLLGNALKFVPKERAPKVEVWSERVDGGRLRVIVQDNGIGIPSEYAERIFLPFERLHPESAWPGTGIGLAIVRKAVDRLGGRAGVASEPDRGSRFWFELPEATDAVEAPRG